MNGLASVQSQERARNGGLSFGERMDLRRALDDIHGSINAMNKTLGALTKAVEALVDSQTTKPRLPSAREVMEAAAMEAGVTIPELLSHQRHLRIVYPRQLVMWILVHRHGLTHTQVGRLLGGRDHTTIMHGVKASKSRLRKRDPEFDDLWKRVQARLGE